MSHIDVIRAWKDENYRSRLSAVEQAQLPPHPAGLIELTDEDLNQSMIAAATGEDCLPTGPICSIIFGCITFLRGCPIPL